MGKKSKKKSKVEANAEMAPFLSFFEPAHSQDIVQAPNPDPEQSPYGPLLSPSSPTVDDFTKCARHHDGCFYALAAQTPQDEGESLRADHPQFMKGRTFRIWMPVTVKETIQGTMKTKRKAKMEWIHGKVDSWTEHDEKDDSRSSTSWLLTAVLDTSRVGMKIPFLEPLSHPGDTAETMISHFFVHRMNVEGGGTVTVFGHDWMLLSFEWMEPLDHGKKGRYYYSPADTFIEAIDRPISIHLLAALRKKAINTMKRLNRQGTTTSNMIEIAANPFRRALMEGDPYKIRVIALSTPFLIFQRALSRFLPYLESHSQNMQIPQLLLMAGVRLFKDRSWWQSQCSFLDPLLMQDSSLSYSFVYMSSFNSLCRALGKWYANAGEYRATQWVFQQQHYVLGVLEGSMHLHLSGMSETLDNPLLTIRERELSIQDIPTMDWSNAHETNVGKRIRKEAKEWIGTTGRVSPWSSYVGVPSTAYHRPLVAKGAPRAIWPSCPVCSAKAKLTCSGCNLVCYCSEQCQKKAWEKTHKYVCSAKPPSKDCPVCGKKAAADMTCSLCLDMSYCSHVCQATHWYVIHRHQCTRLNGPKQENEAAQTGDEK